MVYLKKLTLNKFKSFKHVELEFVKSFTCIIGPNGSGKSNICDALLFGLGESAMHRMRVDKLNQLISIEPKKKKKELSKAYVKIELAGEENVEIIRFARSDGKSLYKINGKKYSRQEAVEIFRKYKFNINEINTITQGEINKLMNSNAKERRELIDICSGVKEFEEKKNESLKELEKVNGRINEAHTMLSERSNFLKELEREKILAEKYIEMSSRLKSLRYSILLKRLEDAQNSKEQYLKILNEHDVKWQQSSTNLDKLKKRLQELAVERQQLTKDLSTSNSSMEEINRKTESINKELTGVDIRIANNTKIIKESSISIEEYQKNLLSIKEKINANANEMASLEPQINALSKELEGYSNPEVSQQKIESDIKELNLQIDQLQQKLDKSKDDVSKYNEEISGIKGQIITFTDLLNASEKQNSEEEKKSLLLKKDADLIKKEHDKYLEKMNQGEQKFLDMQKEISNADSRIISLKDQLSQSHQSSSIARILPAFEGTNGFYGTVSQLFTYSIENALAVEASAGGRMDYIVVSNISKAAEIIQYMKSNNLGRATFIPIEDIQISQSNPAPKNAVSVMDVITFDKKFKKVFEYVFSNTYIINNIEDAKKLGIGRIRYVTNEGEIVEPSGVISGGASKIKRASFAVLEMQLKEETSKKAKLSKNYKDVEEDNFKIRKEYASLEIKLSNKLTEYNDVVSRMSEIRNEIFSTESQIKRFKELLLDAENNYNEKSAELKKVADAYNKAKEKSKEAYENLLNMSKASSGYSAEERKQMEKKRQILEGFKIKNAELSKENQMLKENEQSIIRYIDSASKQISKLSLEMESDKISKEILQKSLNALDFEIKSSSNIGKKAYEHLESIDSESGRLNGEIGRKSVELENIDKQINEFKLGLGQTNVKIDDINAELAAFGEGILVIDNEAENMEKEVNMINGRLAEIGDVNLKAHELYDQRKKEVDEAFSRIKTLEDEKESILKMITEIDSKKLKIFMETFDAVNSNFKKFYNYIFPEKAELELDNPKDPFNSGLVFNIDTGTMLKNLNSLSGGEKSFTILLLVFAIHTYTSSSIYIFDEIDSALDKENSKKISQFLKQLAATSQFIVVSHNDSLVTSADAAIGVTKLNYESRAVGIEISKIINQNGNAYGEKDKK
jgi:chromosome segregation protein